MNLRLLSRVSVRWLHNPPQVSNHAHCFWQSCGVELKDLPDPRVPEFFRPAPRRWLARSPNACARVGPLLSRQCILARINRRVNFFLKTAFHIRLFWTDIEWSDRLCALPRECIDRDVADHEGLRFRAGPRILVRSTVWHVPAAASLPHAPHGHVTTPLTT